jgi:predicted RNase H-like nuclease (RuvC/YqgF family)
MTDFRTPRQKRDAARKARHEAWLMEPEPARERTIEERVEDLEAELSNCRAQGLENEKEIVTLKLEVQELRKMFAEHYHTDRGHETSWPKVAGKAVTPVTTPVTD